MFVYATDDAHSGIQNCNILFNNTLVQTDFEVQEGSNATNNFTVNLPIGFYSWRVECFDNSPNFNKGVSGTRFVRVTASGPIHKIEVPLNATSEVKPAKKYILKQKMGKQ